MRAFVRLLVLVALLPSVAFAQRRDQRREQPRDPRQFQGGSPIDKGSILVGGGASITHSESESNGNETSVTSMSFSPNLLFFIAQRVAVGGQLSVNAFSQDDRSGSGWLLGPAARLYFGQRHSRILPYLGVGIAIGQNTLDTDEPTQVEFESDTWAMEGVAGLTFMISRQVGITAEGFLQRLEETNEASNSPAENELTNTTLGLRFGFAAFLFR